MNTSKVVNDKVQKKTVTGDKQVNQAKQEEPMREMTEEEMNKLLDQLREASLDEVDLWGE